MAWEKCPLCSGSGKIKSDLDVSDVQGNRQCPVCKGKRIIHQVTGVPPGEPMKKPEIKDVSIDDKALDEFRRKIFEEAEKRYREQNPKGKEFLGRKYHPMYGRFGPLIVGLRGDDGRKIVGLHISDIII